LEGQDEIQFKDFYEPFRDLLQEFGPPRKVYHPEFPSPNIQNGKPDLRFVRWHSEEVFHGPVGGWVSG
jgi:hypothetical protein